MSRYYSDEARRDSVWALPDAEVFHADAGALSTHDDDADDVPSGAGWYFWYCLPGCMPDSFPFGPYADEAAAVAALRSQND